MNREGLSRLRHGYGRFSEARQRAIRQISMRALGIHWNQSIDLLYSLQGLRHIEDIKELYPSLLVQQEKALTADYPLDHFFQARRKVLLKNPLINIATGDVYVWESSNSQWLLVENSSEWPIEYRVKFAQMPSGKRNYPKVQGTYALGIISKSHYHRLTEDIPTIMLMSNELPLLVRSSDVTFLESLINRKFQIVKDEGFIQVDFLEVITKGSDVGYLHPKNREILVSQYSSKQIQDGKKRLYLSRIDERRSLPNEAEIISLVKRYNFEIVRGQDLTVIEQIKLFSQAAIVVAPHGGAITNLLFAEKAKLIEIMPLIRINRCFEWQSIVCSHDYSSLFYEKDFVNEKLLEDLISKKIES